MMHFQIHNLEKWATFPGSWEAWFLDVKLRKMDCVQGFVRKSDWLQFAWKLDDYCHFSFEIWRCRPQTRPTYRTTILSYGYLCRKLTLILNMNPSLLIRVMWYRWYMCTTVASHSNLYRCKELWLATKRRLLRGTQTVKHTKMRDMIENIMLVIAVS